MLPQSDKVKHNTQFDGFNVPPNKTQIFFTRDRLPHHPLAMDNFGFMRLGGGNHRTSAFLPERSNYNRIMAQPGRVGGQMGRIGGFGLPEVDEVDDVPVEVEDGDLGQDEEVPLSLAG